MFPYPFPRSYYCCCYYFYFIVVTRVVWKKKDSIEIKSLVGPPRDKTVLNEGPDSGGNKLYSYSIFNWRHVYIYISWPRVQKLFVKSGRDMFRRVVNGGGVRNPRRNFFRSSRVKLSRTWHPGGYRHRGYGAVVTVAIPRYMRYGYTHYRLACIVCVSWKKKQINTTTRHCNRFDGDEVRRRWH